MGSDKLYERERTGNGQNCCAGMTLEDGLCKYILLEKNRERFHICKSICMPVTTGGEAEHKMCFRMLSEQGASHEIPISFALRFNESLIKIIDLPGYSLQEVREAVRYQFEDYFPFAYEECRFDIGEIEYSAVGSSEKKFTAAASRRCVVEAVEAGAEKHGFALLNVEPGQIAFERAVTPALAAEHLIEIYAGKKDLLFILSNLGNGFFYRNTIVRVDGLQYYEKAAAEARIFLNFAVSRIPWYEAKGIIMAGPNADEQLCSAIVRELGVPNIETTNPLALSCPSQCDKIGAAELLLPLGAAVGQI